MILKLSLTVLLLYYLAVLWKYYRQDIAGIFGTAETDEDTDGTGKEPGQPGDPSMSTSSIRILVARGQSRLIFCNAEKLFIAVASNCRRS